MPSGNSSAAGVPAVTSAGRPTPSARTSAPEISPWVGKRSDGERQGGGGVKDGAAGQAARGAGTDVLGQPDHGEASFEDAVVQGKEGGHQLAAEGARDLPSDERAGLAVRTPHLAEIGAHVA